MSPRIHPLIIHGRFPPRHVAAYTPTYYTRHIYMLSCRRVYTLLLYAAHFHPDMSPRIHPLIIRGTFTSCHVASYTPSYYTRHFSTLTCRRVYTLLLYAALFHLVMSPRMHPHIIRGTYPSCHVAAYAPSYYTRQISTSTCRRVYTLLLYAADFHPVMSPRIHPHIIRGTYPSCHVAAYAPSYYTRQISTSTCRRVYTLILYAADFHLVMSPRIHPLIIRGTFPPCHVAAYTPSYYTRHISILSCRRVYTLLLYAAYFHPVMSPRIHPLIIRGIYPS